MAVAVAPDLVQRAWWRHWAAIGMVAARGYPHPTPSLPLHSLRVQEVGRHQQLQRDFWLNFKFLHSREVWSWQGRQAGAAARGYRPRHATATSLPPPFATHAPARMAQVEPEEEEGGNGKGGTRKGEGERRGAPASRSCASSAPCNGSIRLPARRNSSSVEREPAEASMRTREPGARARPTRGRAQADIAQHAEERAQTSTKRPTSGLTSGIRQASWARGGQAGAPDCQRRAPTLQHTRHEIRTA